MINNQEIIPKGWYITTLGEIAEIIMGQSPTGDSYNFNNDGLPFYQGITDFNDKYVDIKTYTNKPIKIIEKNTILFSVRAPVGKVNITKHKACIGRGNAGLIMKNNIQEFLFYLLKYNEKRFISISTGSVFESISGIELKKVPILIPTSKDEQKEIADILSSFDDKIEVLREENKTLEAIAQTIFKEWFVNFNFPDVNGNPYKSSGGKMIASELGEIPEGWRVGKINDFVSDLVSGEWGEELQNAEYSEKVICLRGTDLADIKTNSTTKAPIRYIKVDKLEKAKIFNGDLVVEISGGTIGQSTGRIVYINKEIINRFNSTLISSNFCKVLRLKNLHDQSFIYFYWEFLYSKGLFFNFENGTTGIQNLNLKSFLDIKLVLAKDDLIREFNHLVENLLTYIQKNISQIQTVSTLRDKLLQKLMKGELKVKRRNE